MKSIRSKLIGPACYTISAAALVGAGAYLMFGANKGYGILAVLIAAILCRILILDVAERFAADGETED